MVKVKRRYGYAKLLKILQPSRRRVAPLCQLAGRCGGCQLSHLSYGGQLRYKQNPDCPGAGADQVFRLSCRRYWGWRKQIGRITGIKLSFPFEMGERSDRGFLPLEVIG
ncbi:MAG: hypothetical protein ACLR23_16925 [Clostridia bacterium]